MAVISYRQRIEKILYLFFIKIYDCNRVQEILKKLRKLIKSCKYKGNIMNIQWQVALKLPPTIADFKTVEKDSEK